ncbi:hypothetical protein DFH09DRAFT_1091435 [Mycena vulgaris]|nr:hypothetical protein DFH09DRAFT_1091435 [Mycena vulgaris]
MSLSPRLPSGLPNPCRGMHRATCNDPNSLDPMEKVNASKVLGLLQKAVASSAITSASAPASSALPPRLARPPRLRPPRPPASSGPHARASRDASFSLAHTRLVHARAHLVHARLVRTDAPAHAPELKVQLRGRNLSHRRDLGSCVKLEFPLRNLSRDVKT